MPKQLRPEIPVLWTDRPDITSLLLLQYRPLTTHFDICNFMNDPIARVWASNYQRLKILTFYMNFKLAIDPKVHN